MLTILKVATKKDIKPNQGKINQGWEEQKMEKGEDFNKFSEWVFYAVTQKLSESTLKIRPENKSCPMRE